MFLRKENLNEDDLDGGTDYPRDRLKSIEFAFPRNGPGSLKNENRGCLLRESQVREELDLEDEVIYNYLIRRANITYIVHVGSE